MQTLIVPQGSFQLSRFPVRDNEQFRAWDAADEYVLFELDTFTFEKKPALIVILNDNYGALSVALAETNTNQQFQMLSDSWLSHKALFQNLDKNVKPQQSVTALNSLQTIDGTIDLLIIKIPKTLALLEDQLHRIRPNLNVHTTIIGAGMAKQIHSSTLKLFERITGSTKTSLARKKARLIYAEYDSTILPGINPYPKHAVLENSSIKLVNHANVFSYDRLDIGTRFFLEHIPSSEQSIKIIDLGCGNGLLGIVAAQRHRFAELMFCDESYMAIASAQANFSNAFENSRSAEFLTTDCLNGVTDNSVDMVLNNPPFHIHNAITDTVARQMFKASKRALKKDGQLWVIGNRHLNYRSILKHLFGNCELVASNHKFMIFIATK